MQRTPRAARPSGDSIELLWEEQVERPSGGRPVTLAATRKRAFLRSSRFPAGAGNSCCQQACPPDLVLQDSPVLRSSCDLPSRGRACSNRRRVHRSSSRELWLAGTTSGVPGVAGAASIARVSDRRL